MPTVQRGSSNVVFTTGSNNSAAVTVNHTYGSTAYTAHVTPTTMPASAMSLVVSNKTATSFQVTGFLATKAALTMNFDWAVL
jgi:hypothetical protein